MAGHAARSHEISDHAQRQRMAFIDGALAHGRRCDGQAAGVLQRRQLTGRVRQMYATAGDDQRALGVGQEIGGRSDPRAGQPSMRSKG